MATTVDGAGILAALGLQNLPEPRKVELLTRMTEVLQDRIADRIAAALSAEDRAAYDRLRDGGASDHTLQGFLTHAVPELSQMIAEEVSVLQEQLVADVGVVHAMLNTAQRA